MILCDIGNTTADVYESGNKRKITLTEFNPEFIQGEIWYASVNSVISSRVHMLDNWHNIADLIDWDKYYPTMGIDRILACEAVDNGVIIDAGSAITVDVMKDGVYKGGFISLGLRAAQKAYASLSPALDVSFNFEVDLDKMAKNTPDAVTIGFLAPLVHRIEGMGGPLVLSGGDAKAMKRFLPDALIDEDLIFRGMQKLINKGFEC